VFGKQMSFGEIRKAGLSDDVCGSGSLMGQGADIDHESNQVP
jgi:hypothetical protein